MIPLVGSWSPQPEEETLDPAVGSGGSILQKAGLTPWVDQDLAPALKLRVRRGFSVQVKQTGSPAAPVWEIRPNQPVSVKHPRQIPKVSGVPTDPDESGFLGLIPLGAKLGLVALRKQNQKHKQIKENPWEDLSSGLDGGGLERSSRGPSPEDGVGSLTLIDTDGYRQDLP